jgi:hypothetical protein
MPSQGPFSDSGANVNPVNIFGGAILSCGTRLRDPKTTQVTHLSILSSAIRRFPSLLNSLLLDPQSPSEYLQYGIAIPDQEGWCAGCYRFCWPALHPPAPEPPALCPPRRRCLVAICRKEVQGCREVEAGLAHGQGRRPGREGVQGQRVLGVRHCL